MYFDIGYLIMIRLQHDKKPIRVLTILNIHPYEVIHEYSLFERGRAFCFKRIKLD